MLENFGTSTLLLSPTLSSKHGGDGTRRVKGRDEGVALSEQLAPALQRGSPLAQVVRLCCGDARTREALEFAAAKLQHHRRGPTQEPALWHALRVAAVVAILFGASAPEMIAAALLHDVLEDSDAKSEELRERFGEFVADAVALLTKPAALPKAERERVYRERLLSGSEAVLLIKLADYYDNLHCRRGTPKIAKCRESAAAFLNALRSQQRLRGRLRTAAALVDSTIATIRVGTRAADARACYEAARSISK